MSDQDLTELVFILDRSGSMADRASDVLGGFNRLIEQQRAQPGRANVTLWLFDDRHDQISDAADIRMFSPLTDKVYFARGATALHDAIGMCFARVGERLRATPEDKRPKKVIVTIMTDGEENNSREYNGARIKQIIEHQRDKYGWEVVFLGANQDAILAAGSIGIPAAQAMSFAPTQRGVGATYAVMSSYVSSSRGAPVGAAAPVFSMEDRASAMADDDSSTKAKP